jgi:hypothetical protein
LDWFRRSCSSSRLFFSCQQTSRAFSLATFFNHTEIFSCAAVCRLLFPSHSSFKKNKMQLVQVQSYGFLPVVGGGGHSSPSSQMAVTVRGRVSPVRRQLFAADPEGDAQELEHRRSVQRQMDHLQQENSRKWNFDFKNEVPLGGRYVWQSATLPFDGRPSHPLPPLTGIKRPIDNQDSAMAAPLFKQMKHDSINNNHRSANQTKITGKYLSLNSLFPICVCRFSQGLNLETRVCVLASV